jgi:type VI secretion system protein ImpE
MSLSISSQLHTPAQQALKQGDTAETLRLLQQQIRANPQDAKLRIFLFQLLCVLGQWDRALNQLSVISELDREADPMVKTYREVIRCEVLRAAVFKGTKAPLLFGEPQPWLALLIEAMLRQGRGDIAAAEQLRARAFDEAPATRGKAGEQAFEWIADADSRLGPVLEIIVDGKYYWLPFSRLSRIEFEAPVDLRDTVWLPSQFTLANGGEAVGFVPTRYPDSEGAAAGYQLARRTDWQEPHPGHFVGLGQRVFVAEELELPILDLRVLELEGTEA